MQTKPAPVSLGEALRWWFKLGFISFGGPAAQIAMMHQELVEKRRWISERRFLHALNYCMLLPGPEAQQLATYIGWLLHGTRGGIVAGALFVLPSLLILILLSWLYLSLGAHLSTQLLYGIKPAVVALVLFAAWRIGNKVLKTLPAWIIAIAALAGLWLAHLPFPALIVAAGVAGWLLRAQMGQGGGHAAGKGSGAPALIDDDDPVPPQAAFSRPRLLRQVAVGLALWGAGMGLLVLLRQDVLTHMGLFFSKAALVTFGGAYAVLPYVFQQAVTVHGWLTPAQMIDGLALGETTPGPLIMIVSFIGYVGAAQSSADPLLMGIAGACVATFFTFLPSFLFILIGAPVIERTREDFRLAGPLNAITAAVLGAILYLGLTLALAVFSPQAGGIDWFALGLSALALLAMIRNWLGMIPVIALSGAVGMAWKFWGA